MQFNDTHAAKARRAAIASRDANRILLHFKKSVAVKLYYVGLNAVTAAAMSDNDLLLLKGIGPKAVEAIRMAANTASMKTKDDCGVFVQH